MLKLSQDELVRARLLGDWDTLWTAAIPWVKFVVSTMGQDEDLTQTGHLAAGQAVRTWDPDKGAFSTHICNCVRGACQTYLSTRDSGGIGSSWQRRQGKAVEMVDMQLELDEEAPDLSELTYEATGAVPEGYGDAGAELQRETAKEAIRGLLEKLTPMEAYALRIAFGDQTIKSNTSHRRMAQRSIKKLAQFQKSSYIRDTGLNLRVQQTHVRASRHPGFWNGLVSVMGDVSAWRESKGRVWNDWSWKPEREKDGQQSSARTLKEDAHRTRQLYSALRDRRVRGVPNPIGNLDTAHSN